VSLSIGPPRAVLIDMDDTILGGARRPDILRQVALDLAGALNGHDPHELSQRLELAFRAFWSDPARHKVARFGVAAARRGVVREVFESLEGLSPQFADAFADRFSATREAMTTLFPGALEGLQSLRNLDLRLGLITNGDGPGQRAKIERFNLAPWFDHIQIEGEMGFGKPEPRAYHHAAESLGVGITETWVVGDDLEWEVRAPQRLGMTAIWCDGFVQGLPADTDCRPDHIIHRLDQIAPLIRSGRR
jgi:putative hydrolase of the HAD superfamily